MHSFQENMEHFSGQMTWLGNKASLGKFKKIKTPKHLFWPQFYETRSQLQEEDCKKTQTRRGKTTCCCTSSGSPKKPERKAKHKQKTKGTVIQNLWATAKGALKRHVYSNSLSQEIRKIWNKQSILTPKGTREKTKPKVDRRKEIIKIREEIHEIETKKKNRNYQ